MNDQPVQMEIKYILGNAINLSGKETIIKDIITQISGHNNGVFYRHNPLPLFLTSFFRTVSPAELDDHALQPLLNQNLQPAAVLHMKTCGTFWVKNEAHTEPLINLAAILMNARAESYIKLSDVDTEHLDTIVVPKYIIASRNDIILQNRVKGMNAIFKRYTDHELVVNLGKAENLSPFVWERASEVQSIPESVRNITIMSEGLTTIDHSFLARCKRNRKVLLRIMIPNNVNVISKPIPKNDDDAHDHYGEMPNATDLARVCEEQNECFDRISQRME